ncbi:G1 family glutamic endopeptidase [Ferrimicrobium sp.]|uniref:G1 family glutamic endopeptidase n=1 Tax=Ferrimicrobium sp. TaxID=2926050 RepID=UPI0026204E3C|nr:G1 family glutamic endopeptidase [Ferrimicrobium sp.]
MVRHSSVGKLAIVGATAALAVGMWSAQTAPVTHPKISDPQTFATSRRSLETKSSANSLVNLIQQYDQSAAATPTVSSTGSGSPLKIQAPTGLGAIEGTQVQQQLSATGGDGGLQWSMNSSLGWLQITPGGLLYGVPTSPGDGQATITVTDAAGSSSQVTIPIVVDVPSGNWSGYVDYSPNGVPFTKASAQFVVPTISSSLPQSCANDVSGGMSLSCSLAEWVGIGGTSGNETLIQAGVYEIPDLATGSVKIVPWVENLPSPSQTVPNMNVVPGNDMQVTVAQVAGTEWKVTVADLSTGQSVSGVGNYYGSGDSADFIVEAPTTAAGQTAPTPFSSPIKFFDVQVSSSAQAGQVMVPTAMVQSGNVATYPGQFHNSYDGFKVYYDDQQS